MASSTEDLKKENEELKKKIQQLQERLQGGKAGSFAAPRETWPDNEALTIVVLGASGNHEILHRVDVCFVNER